MAKQQRALPVRKQRDRSRDEESLLLRSAESLGRVIGALQRQLDGAAKGLSKTATDAVKSVAGTEDATDNRGTTRGSRPPLKRQAPKTRKTTSTRAAGKTTKKAGTTGGAREQTGPRKAGSRKTTRSR